MRMLVFLVVAFAVMFFMHWTVYVSLTSAFDTTLPNAYPLLTALSASYLVASLLVRKVGGAVADGIYFVAATWLGTIFILFSLQLISLIFSLVTGISSLWLSGSLFIFGLNLAAYAIWNGRRLTVKEYTIPLKNLTKSLRMVHLSDIHIGTVHQTRFLERVVALTNEQTPDLVCITGDLFDGSVAIDESILAPLNTLVAPTFFSNGNHEEYEGLNHVRETLGHIKVELLENRHVVHKGIQIIGVNDRQSLRRSETLSGILDSLKLDATLPTILMYHTPVEWDAARAKGVGLMLSGHTHNGQIYPFTLLVRLFFKYVVHLYEKDGHYLHITPGTGTWGPPMRLGSNNQVTVLHLVPGE
jgi:hypothetical protein